MVAASFARGRGAQVDLMAQVAQVAQVVRLFHLCLAHLPGHGAQFLELGELVEQLVGHWAAAPYLQAP